MAGEGRGDEPLSQELLDASAALDELVRERVADPGEVVVVVEDEAPSALSRSEVWRELYLAGRKPGVAIGDLLREEARGMRLHGRRRDPGGPGRTGS